MAKSDIESEIVSFNCERVVFSLSLSCWLTLLLLHCKVIGWSRPYTCRRFFSLSQHFFLQIFSYWHGRPSKHVSLLSRELVWFSSWLNPWYHLHSMLTAQSISWCLCFFQPFSSIVFAFLGWHLGCCYTVRSIVACFLICYSTSLKLHL